MEDPINEHRIISPSDICTLLKIQQSTLRKYALLLKSAGYHFDENERGQRAYYEKDILTFKKLIEIKNSSAMTLEQSVSAVMTWLGQSDMSVRDTGNNVEIKRYSEDMDELKGIVYQQNELILELLKEVRELKEHDRIFMENVRQMQEEKQLLLAAAKEEEQKNFWQRLSSLFRN